LQRSNIPDAATVQTVELRVRRKSVTGTSPFSTHGSFVLDIKTGRTQFRLRLTTGDNDPLKTSTTS
jgi:hypothetical protein